MKFISENIKSNIEKILSTSVENKQQVYKQIVNHIDLTTLEGTDNGKKWKLCVNKHIQ